MGERSRTARDPAPGAVSRKEVLHRLIRTRIEGKILSGEWPPGHRIPFEHELMAEYGCARMTVSKALYALAEAGLIERRRRAGSFVRRPPSPSAVLAIPDIEAEVRARGEPYRYELLDMRRRSATKADRALLGSLPEGAILFLCCRHFAGARPFALEERRIVANAVPDLAKADFRAESPGAWLLENIPWHAAEHQITAVGARPRIALLLGLPRGTACLVVDRRTWRGTTLITAVRTWFPGDLQKLIARFTPSGSPERVMTGSREGSADRA